MATASTATNPCNLEPRSGVAALLLRFERKVDRETPSGRDGTCHEWQGRVDGRGYGEIKVGGRYKKAHRLALFGFEDWDNPLFACHRCDNPKCVNAAHLFAGTSADNVRDMAAKGRSPTGRMARCLSDEHVRQIRVSDERECVLAKRYGVNGTAIRQVRNRITYRDVA